MKELTIDRNDWIRGLINLQYNFTDNSSLLRKDGKKCCLGFLCLSEGFAEEQILSCARPNSVSGINKFPSHIVEKLIDNYYGTNCDSEFVRIAMRINDSQNIINEEVRESKLVELFAENGYDLKFIN